jgi:hypothetical protein
MMAVGDAAAPIKHRLPANGADKVVRREVVAPAALDDLLPAMATPSTWIPPTRGEDLSAAKGRLGEAFWHAGFEEIIDLKLTGER